MNWNIIKDNRCPRCHKDFTKGMEITEGGKLDDMIAGDMTGKMIIHTPCGFMITEQRYKEIVSGIVEKEIKQGYL
jgi:hypothetical protein